MSHHSLYESNWINLVFENRNKEYGAFQLRQETTKTSFHALCIGILVCTALIILPNLLLRPKSISVPTAPDFTETVIQLKDIYSIENKKKAASAPLPAAQQQKAVDKIDSKQLINPTVVSATQAVDTKFILERNNPIDNTTTGTALNGTGTSTGESVVNGTGNGTGTEISNTNGTELVTTELLDSKPQFPGGIEKFYRYIGNHFNSPTLDENRNVRIFVSFVVERDGSMSNIKVMNNPGAVLEKEAIRVLQSIKAKWTPGMLHSKPVRTAYNLPITVLIN
ncbi:energy transducer TonB [Flavobacterium undicola]|uniref:energy transducer TonB n=1 Tax=Flavobacterium undicola TaxID=1932779 RepID=UPI0013788E3D|nr:energy transducer TonB [Flavobacterium undicola]MBA0883875.1 energy transducer TonB [Flavobacterium undicola]